MHGIVALIGSTGAALPPPLASSALAVPKPEASGGDGSGREVKRSTPFSQPLEGHDGQIERLLSSSATVFMTKELYRPKPPHSLQASQT